MIPSWELYGTFLAVLKGGSLSAAARSLNLAQPTVRRRIEELEELLGVVLFTRAPHGLVPTEAAHATLPHAEAMAASANALLRAVSAPPREERGTVRITASEVVGAEVLPPILAELCLEHPGLQVELALSNRSEDLLRREADVAVRMVAPTQKALVARRVGAVPLGLFARSEYLRRRQAPRTLPELLEGHLLIGADRERGLLEGLRAVGLQATPRDFAFRSDSDLAQLAAIRAGLGIGVCQTPLAAHEPSLQRVLPQVELALDTWVVTHEDLRDVRRVRRVFEHLVKRLGEYVQGGTRPAVRVARPPGRSARRGP